MTETATISISLESLAPINTNERRASIARDAAPGRSSMDEIRQEPDENAAGRETREISKGKTFGLFATLTGTTAVASFSTGLLTVCLPGMAKELHLPNNLLLWPASVYSLSLGCLLIIAGSIADLIGSRKVFLLGSFLQGIFVLACGFSRTGIQLIVFRALQGIAVAMDLPTAVSIITTNFASGKRRNLGLAFMGAGQPFGYLLGLVLGGLFIDTIGWRAAYYVCAASNGIFFATSYWTIPKDMNKSLVNLKHFKEEVDWVGALIASVCLALLSYVLASITGTLSHIRNPVNIALLSLSLALVPGFIFWVARQERLNKPALIPNSIWKNAAFSSICVTLMLSWAVLNGMEWYASLFYQDVQMLSALQTSLRFMPNIVSGVILNVATGFLAHKFRVDRLIVISSLIAAVSPLLMALINPAWPYWYMAFWSMLLSPFSADVLFTVAAIVISDIFPEKTQALAGAVFQTVAQFGTSLGLAIMASISNTVTDGSDYQNKTSPKALMEGYRVTFWVSFAWMILAGVVGGFGLRRAGKVGLKRE